jgi:hypothetical protein
MHIWLLERVLIKPMHPIPKNNTILSYEAKRVMWHFSQFVAIAAIELKGSITILAITTFSLNARLFLFSIISNKP